MTMEEATKELQNCSDTQFDGKVVEAFSKEIINFKPTLTTFSKEHLDKYYMPDN